MTCEYCVHFGVCPSRQEANKPCCFFKNRSKFIELPCRVGDIAYAICSGKSVCVSNSKPAIKEGIITELRFNFNMELLATVHNIATGVIGRTVFLTREEAEKALEGI